MKEVSTGVEDIRGETFDGTATVNTDNVEIYYGDTDKTSNMYFVSGTSIVVLMSEEELDAVFDQYEIKIYDN